MSKKILPLTFTALCLLVCLIPSVGTIFRPSTDKIGNEQRLEQPALIREDGSLNVGYFTDLGAYFEQNFTFRAEAITADAQIQADVFGTSDIDTVLVGTDGWLYYTATLDDYLGRDPMTAREARDAVHNLGLIRDYARSQGADFLFTIAPNKNTLYPEHMPYYTSLKAGDVHNRDLVRAALADSDVPYADLFGVFEEQDEVLYFARDSHWNNKGALLAYDTILTALGKAHDDYAAAPVLRRRDFIGDLSRMLYPVGGEAEYNWYYGAEERYTTGANSVEDARITTQNPDAAGSLYMYRDSFGNALVPFFAAAYGEATFSKSFTANLEQVFSSGHPDVYIMELVERNLSWLITQPPVFPSPKLSGYRLAEGDPADAVVRAEPCPSARTSFIQFTGEVDSASLADDDVICVAVTDASGATVTYECCALRADGDRTGFIAYAHAADYPDGCELDISVIKQSGSEFTLLATAQVTAGGNDENS